MSRLGAPRTAAIFAGAGAYINLVEHPARMMLIPGPAATNQLLLAPGRDLAATDTRGLLERWAKLHGVRTVLSLAATSA